MSLRVSALVRAFVRGHANSHGSVNLNDAFATILHIAGGLQAESLDALDARDSGAVPLKDEVCVLDYLSHSGGA